MDFWLHSGEGGGLAASTFTSSAAGPPTRSTTAGSPTATGQRLLAQFAALRKDYAAWEKERLTPGGLFWQRDVSDGMESSISGGRKVKNLRPTINSYMYANARAIAAIAAHGGGRSRRAPNTSARPPRSAS